MTPLHPTVIYDCGHLGYFALGPQYANRDGPVPARELLKDSGYTGKLTPWNCMACHRKEILGILRPGLERGP